MASVVGICNSALVKLGATRIVSLTEGSKNANLCSEQFAKIRDDLLRGHSWNFAMARAKPAQLDASPAFGFDHAFQLPASFMRAVTVHPDDGGRAPVAYKIEGRQLLADSSEIYLRFVSQVTDPNVMDPAFRETLAWALAFDLAIPITQSSTTREQMAHGLRDALSKAKSVDAIEDFPETTPDTAWAVERN
jgi:hypothetical protein